ncbi:hypothetical protein NQ318_011543 [Aromia moschata]|uniref:Uncharacterized protein n=1 Tax=Aromia moschata TaxID=1265417 RepID=A0AAV8Z7D0_9CUCU|nr:hypothetical protein NQ318_011543 [Aromia moschata]
MRELHTQNPEKVNVWAGIIGENNIGPFFIDGNLNGETYLAQLQNNMGKNGVAKVTELMLLPARCERVATSLNRTVSGDTFPTLSSLDKPMPHLAS